MEYSAHQEIELDLYRRAISLLGGSTDSTTEIFDAVLASGRQVRRFFHTPEHFFTVGGKTEALKRAMQGREPFTSALQALRYKAGCDHDVVYAQVDQKSNYGSIHPDIQRFIERLGSLSEQNKGEIRVEFDYEALGEKTTRLVQAVNQIFGFDAQANVLNLQWFTNQNEYLSALFALSSGLQMELDEKYLLAEAAMIEATVPFGPPARLPALQERLRIANNALESPLSPDEISETMRQAEAASNQDIGDFQKHFFDCIAGTFMVLLENSMGNVSADNADQIDPIAMTKAITGMHRFLVALAEASQQSPVPTRCIFHTLDGSRHPAEAQSVAILKRICNYLHEAADNLTLLADHYQNQTGAEPTSWGEIRQMLSPQHPLQIQSAHRFFCLIGCQTLNELLGSQRLSRDEKRFVDQLLQLRMQVSLPLSLSVDSGKSSRPDAPVAASI